jgi:hypothetical protein
VNAGEIIRAALTFHLNRLSPGEAEDADTFNTCRNALNFIVDEWNGIKAFLFRVIRTQGTVTGSTGTLGTTWAALSPGDLILGASYNDGTQDIPLDELTIEQYQEISVKTTAGNPRYWAHDGQSTVYFYPVPTSVAVTLRTKGPLSDFADLTTEYTAPAGYKSALAVELAKKVAPTMLGAIPPQLFAAASAARSRIHAQAYVPAVIDTDDRWDYDIGRGW